MSQYMKQADRNAVKHPGLEPWLASLGPAAVAQALADLDEDAAVFAVDANRDVVLTAIEGGGDGDQEAPGR